MTTQEIRILIVDDHEVIRRGLKACIQTFQGIRLAGEASNGFEAVQACQQLQPHIILMDIVMPIMDGIAATQLIHEQQPHIEIIALTSYKDKDNVQQMLRAGASSYLLKDTSVTILEQVIHQTMVGKSTLNKEVKAALLEPNKKDYALNQREREVLSYLVKGLNNREIAQAMSVSRATVKYYVSSILDKLDVSNRTEAAILADREGLVEDDKTVYKPH